MEDLNCVIRLFLKQYPTIGKISIDMIITDLHPKCILDRNVAPNLTLVLGQPTNDLKNVLTGVLPYDFQFMIESGYVKGSRADSLDELSNVSNVAFDLLHKAIIFMGNPWASQKDVTDLNIVGYEYKSIVKSDHKNFGKDSIHLSSNVVDKKHCPKPLLQFLV